MGEPGKRLVSEISQTQKDKFCMVPLIIGKFMETESRLEFTRSLGSGGGDEELLLNGYRVDV